MDSTCVNTDTIPSEISDDERYKTLLGLVSHYSPSGSEREVVNWLTKRMLSLGYDRAFADGGGNAVGVIGEGEKQIVLLGHIDTVPGEIPLRVEDGFLYGRGSVDAKSPLTCFVDGAAKLGRIPGWQIVVIGCVDEECDGMGARFAVPFYHPECVIVGEPSRWDRIALGYKGCAWASIQVSYPLSHGASSEETPCESLAHIWKRIEMWRDGYNDEHPKLFDQVMLSFLYTSEAETVPSRAG